MSVESELCQNEGNVGTNQGSVAWLGENGTISKQKIKCEFSSVTLKEIGFDLTFKASKDTDLACYLDPQYEHKSRTNLLEPELLWGPIWVECDKKKNWIPGDSLRCKLIRSGKAFLRPYLLSVSCEESFSQRFEKPSLLWSYIQWSETFHVLSHHSRLKSMPLFFSAPRERFLNRWLRLNRLSSTHLSTSSSTHDLMTFLQYLVNQDESLEGLNLVTEDGLNSQARPYGLRSMIIPSEDDTFLMRLERRRWMECQVYNDYI